MRGYLGHAPPMQAAAWGAIGSFTASGIALFLSWVNGRREHQARELAERAVARQVLIERVTAKGVCIANHTTMHVTDLRLERAILGHTDEISGDLLRWVFTGDTEPLVPPGERAYYTWEWTPAAVNPNAPSPPEDLVPRHLQIRYSFRDAQGVRWARNGYGPPWRVLVVSRHDRTWLRSPVWKIRHSNWFLRMRYRVQLDRR